MEADEYPRREPCADCGEEVLVVLVKGAEVRANPHEHEPSEGKFPEDGVVLRENGTAKKWRPRWAGGNGRYQGEAVHRLHACAAAAGTMRGVPDRGVPRVSSTAA